MTLFLNKQPGDGTYYKLYNMIPKEQTNVLNKENDYQNFKLIHDKLNIIELDETSISSSPSTLKVFLEKSKDYNILIVYMQNTPTITSWFHDAALRSIKARCIVLDDIQNLNKFIN